MVPHIFSMVPYIFSMAPHIYLLVSVSMAPHTWSAIQKPIITQTMAVVAPTTNESMHIFKSFLRFIFNLLLSPCITAPALRKSSVTATAHYFVDPLRQRPIALSAQRSNGPTAHCSIYIGP